MEVEEHVAIGLSMGKHEPTTIIGAKEARTASVVPDAEVVGVSIAEDTIKGYPPCSSRLWNEWSMRSGGVWEEEPWELTQRRGSLDSKPPIMACPRHAEEVDGAW
jgi:hypothetical protein